MLPSLLRIIQREEREQYCAVLDLEEQRRFPCQGRFNDGSRTRMACVSPGEQIGSTPSTLLEAGDGDPAGSVLRGLAHPEPSRQKGRASPRSSQTNDPLVGDRFLRLRNPLRPRGRVGHPGHERPPLRPLLVGRLAEARLVVMSHETPSLPEELRLPPDDHMERSGGLGCSTGGLLGRNSLTNFDIRRRAAEKASEGVDIARPCEERICSRLLATGDARPHGLEEAACYVVENPHAAGEL